MQAAHVHHLVCPACLSELELVNGSDGEHTVIVEGWLACAGCAHRYPIFGGIPRFVDSQAFTSGFGFQRQRHARTQLDSYTGIPMSETRFFARTSWPWDLTGQRVLEVAGGAGRFTEQALTTGAFVASLDYSLAVEANWLNNGHHPNLLIVQGDVYRMPFRRNYFDKLYCFGMLQHTPRPRDAFMALPAYLKPGGAIAADVYKRTLGGRYLSTKYYVRWLTKRVQPERLYLAICSWINFMWPISRVLAKIPRVGRLVNWRLLVADHSDMPLPPELLKECAYLDTFDLLSPAFDYPQTLGEFRTWFEDAGLDDIDVRYGYNGVQGRGARP